MTPGGRLAAGAGALLLCGQYFVAECVAAAAWAHPYSYSRNYISDLGVTSCLAGGPCSPLGWVMNGAFLLAGALTVLAAWLLGPLLLLRRRSRWLFIGLAGIHGAGSAAVGLVHSAPGTRAGTPHLHVVAAYAAIVGGNLGLVVLGSALSPLWAARPVRVASIALGLFGLACGAALVLTRGLPPGLLERGAVDTIPLAEVAGGILLAIRLHGAFGRTPLARTT